MSTSTPEDNELTPIVLAISAEFDAAFYEAAYPDLQIERSGLLDHFCRIGWIEGRNPNRFFDTVSYLLEHPDVAISGINPFHHYLLFGKREGRNVATGLIPSVHSKRLFGYEIGDWVERVRATVDCDYYRTQIPDVEARGIDLAAHFAFRGWREGIHPSPRITLATLLKTYPQAWTFLVNPVVVDQELMAGKYAPTCHPPQTNGAPIQLTSPIKTDLKQISIHSRDDTDAIAHEFDADYYRRAYDDVAKSNVDPLKHYFYTGWWEGRNPSPNFDSTFYLSTYPEVRSAHVNPLWHFVMLGRAQGYLPKPPNDEATSQPQERTTAADLDIQKSLVATEFSRSYYLKQNPDVSAANLDPLDHFFYTGWREGRNPNKNFDVNYYLKVNQDIAALGINPFWHYLAAGRSEGRRPRRPGGVRRQLIEDAREPHLLMADYPIDPDSEPMTEEALEALLSAHLTDKDGLLVSLSHDRYTRVVGGTQIFIADEQRKFSDQNQVYLHLSPQRPRLTLAPVDDDFCVNLIIDGTIHGVTRIRSATSVFRKIDISATLFSALIVHSIFGFNESQICALHEALVPKRTFFWLHDYATLCESYNLLRNNVEFCHAPEPKSMVCRICVYGPGRPMHLDRMKQLFASCHFEVLSPSQHTLDFWVSKSMLPYASASVHSHWSLQEEKGRLPRKSKRQGKNDPIRIGFLGFPSPGKGWHLFSELVDEFADDSRYRFFHFSAQGVEHNSSLQSVVTKVTPADRSAAIRLLKRHAIDYVALLSPWPETFSFAAHECLLAGAELLCLTNSGNIADIVTRRRVGHVFATLRELQIFLRSGEAVRLATQSRGRRPGFRLDDCGTTATIAGLPGCAMAS